MHLYSISCSLKHAAAVGVVCIHACSFLHPVLSPQPCLQNYLNNQHQKHCLHKTHGLIGQSPACLNPTCPIPPGCKVYAAALCCLSPSMPCNLKYAAGWVHPCMLTTAQSCLQNLTDQNPTTKTRLPRILSLEPTCAIPPRCRVLCNCCLQCSSRVDHRHGLQQQWLLRQLLSRLLLLYCC